MVTRQLLCTCDVLQYYFIKSIKMKIEFNLNQIGTHSNVTSFLVLLELWSSLDKGPNMIKTSWQIVYQFDLNGFSKQYCETSHRHESGLFTIYWAVRHSLCWPLTLTLIALAFGLLLSLLQSKDQLSMEAQPRTLITIKPEQRIRASPGILSLGPSFLLLGLMLTSVATGKLPKKQGPQVEVNQRGSRVLQWWGDFAPTYSPLYTQYRYRADTVVWK